MKMNIAVFSDIFYPEHAGVTDSISTMVQELARRGHRILCVGPRYPKSAYVSLSLPYREPDWGENVSFLRLPSVGVTSGSGHGRAAIPTGRSISALRRFRPDVIHVQTPYGTGLEGLRAAKKLDVALVGTQHTPIGEFVMRYGLIRTRWMANLASRYDAWFYNHCDFLSSPCQAIFDEWPGFRSSVPHHPIPNPLRTELFSPGEGGGKNFTLMFSGRLAKEKNVDLVLLAVKRLAPEIPRISFTVVGQGPEERHLKGLAAEYGIADRVKFTGFLPEDHLQEAYRKADVFVIMSDAETQSLVSMQAMLSGLPVVAAAIWGLKEYVQPDRGFLVPARDVDALVLRIRELYGDPELRRRLGEGGRRFAEGLAPERIAEIWEKEYAQAIERHRPQ